MVDISTVYLAAVVASLFPPPLPHPIMHPFPQAHADLDIGVTVPQVSRWSYVTNPDNIDVPVPLLGAVSHASLRVNIAGEEGLDSPAQVRYWGGLA